MAIIRRIWQRKFLIACRCRSSSSSVYVNNASAPQSLGPECPVTRRGYLGFRSRLASSRCSSSPALRLITHRSFLSGNHHLSNRCFSSLAALEPAVGGIVNVPLAQTGEGIAECELLKWFVHEGEDVDEFQPLCEVQSDKATIEITSRYKGKVIKVLHAPGDIVKVGETLLQVSTEEIHDAPMSSACLADDTPPVQDAGPTSSHISTVSEMKQGGTLSTPAVRSLAKQYGIDIKEVQGTGPGGRVLKEDILKFASAIAVNKESGILGTESDRRSASVAANSNDKTIPLRGFQRAMVKSMALAAKIPHFHYVEEINCDALTELKASFQRLYSDPSIKFTFLPVLVKSLSMALSKHPLLNSIFNEEGLEVVAKGEHNIGIAMATPTGLVVPNIKGVQSLSTLEVTKELSRLQQLAAENKLAPDDISGGTITLSNIGAIGGKFGSPLVNFPEVAIIALGRIQKVAQFTDDGSVYPASIMNVNIGADHRVLDGAAVARFCNEWKKLIEEPQLMLLHMR